MLGYLCFVIALFCPESPQWLIVHGHRKEAIKSLNTIARRNGTTARIPEDAIFEEDPNTQEHDRAVSRSVITNEEMETEADES